ncbi:fibronectin type III domain-containing protein [Actinopolymorpha singaporensis]
MLVVAGGLAVFEGGASAAAYSGPWSVTLSREGSGANLVFDETNAVLTNSSTSNLVNLDVSGGGSSYDFEFQAPDKAAMAAGWYPDAQRYPFQEAGRPGMSVAGGCNEVTGSFEVRDIAWSSGTLTKLWLLYEHHCEGGEKADFGEIRFGMPTASTDVEPHALHWPDTYPGGQSKVVPVLVRQRGTSAGSVSAVALEGANPQDFAIRTDECTGQTLDEGQSCLVNVRFAPQAPGPRTAVLRITTNARTIRVPLDGLGVAGTTDWSMQSDSGDYIGGGKTYHYTTDTDIVAFSGSRTLVSGGVDAANGDSWGATFVPAQGDILVQGNTYPDAHRYPFNGTGAGMNVSGEGRGCNKLVGDFTVDQVGFTSTGTLDRLDLTFEQHCEEGTPALHGRLRYRARADYTAPARVTNATATRTSGTTAHLTWSNPADADRAGTVVRYLPDTSAPPTDPTAGHLAYTGNGTSVDLSGLASGRTYSVGIFTYDSTGNVSSARVVTIPGSYAPTLSFTTSATSLTYGGAVTMSGRLTDPQGGALPSIPVHVQYRSLGSSAWKTLVSGTTSSTGQITASIKPSATRDFRLLSDASEQYASATSPVVRVNVAQKVTAASDKSSILLGQTLTITGSVAPSHAGGTVLLQAYYSGAWHTVKSATLSSSSTYSVSYKPSSKGSKPFRVYRSADTDHLANVSPSLTVTVG